MRSTEVAFCGSIICFIILCIQTQARLMTGYDELQRQSKLRKRGGESDYVTEEELQASLDEIRTDFGAGLDEVKGAVNIIKAQMDSQATSLTDLSGTVDAIDTRLGVDHCAAAPCQNKGVCQNRLDGYLCECEPSFIGHNCEQVTGRLVSNKLTVNNGGSEGSWGEWSMCSPATYAWSFRIKLERPLDGDDSAMNNIELGCWKPTTGENLDKIKSGYGPFGTWRSWQDCPTGELYYAFTMKVEGDQGSTKDDSSVNGVTMTCNGGSTHTGDIGPEGSFGSTASCPASTAICGVRTKIEGDQGGNDDSGLNDIQFLCCAY